MSNETRQEIVRYSHVRQLNAPPIESLNENEDLLTSERSRFRPIKHTYTDGHTFDISDELDEIDYERSASGTLYYESEVYREYYVYDEEGNGGSRCGADRTSSSAKDSEFALKYCVRQNDKCCQTDDVPPNCSVSPPNVSMLLAKANRMLQFNSLRSPNDNQSMENQMVYFRNSGMNQSQLISVQQLRDNFTDSMDQSVDVSQDSYANMDGWSLAENRRRCNNNNNAHALWEHCAACTTDIVSMPANSLLKDELSAEGDEIMSDLKYMQNLYIGSDWEDENDSDCDCVDEDDGLMQSLEPKTMNKKLNLPIDAGNDDAVGDGYNDELSTSSHIYSNVNKLISDLLQPENAQNLVQAISEKCQSQIGRITTEESSQNDAFINENQNDHSTKDAQQTKSVPGCSLSVNNTNSNTNYFGSLWANSDNSIWRKDQTVETESIWSNAVQTDGGKTIKQFGAKPLSKLCDQWEHSNLEQIWTKTPLDPDECARSSDDVEMKNADQMLCNTDSTIYTTVNTDGGCKSFAQPTTSTIANDNNQNALEKFIELIKQANRKTDTNESTLPATKQVENCTTTHQHHHQHHATGDMNRLINNRFDRKRRHSATSQNFFDHVKYALPNCDEIDGTKKLATKTANDYDDTKLILDGDGNVDDDSLRKTTTIITCKYWTATDSFCLTSTLAFNNNNNNNSILKNNGNIFTCYQHQQQLLQQQSKDQLINTMTGNDSLTMHPTQFFKQVAAMVTRPLTR